MSFMVGYFLLVIVVEIHSLQSLQKKGISRPALAHIFILHSIQQVSSKESGLLRTSVLFIKQQHQCCLLPSEFMKALSG